MGKQKGMLEKLERMVNLNFFHFGFFFEEAGIDGEGGEGVATCFSIFFFDIGGLKNPVVIN